MHFDPPQPPRTIAILSWVFYSISALMMLGVVLIRWSSLTRSTCVPGYAPVRERTIELVVTVVLYAIVSAILLKLVVLRDKQQDAHGAAIALALLAGGIPFVSFFFALFSAAMC